MSSSLRVTWCFSALLDAVEGKSQPGLGEGVSGARHGCWARFWIRDTAVYVLCKFIQLREAERRAPQFTSGSGVRPGSGDGSQPRIPSLIKTLNSEQKKANDKQRNPRRILEAAGILLLVDKDGGVLRVSSFLHCLPGVLTSVCFLTPTPDFCVYPQLFVGMLLINGENYTTLTTVCCNNRLFLWSFLFHLFPFQPLSGFSVFIFGLPRNKHNSSTQKKGNNISALTL